MRASFQEYTQIGAYLRASRELSHWITGAKVFALLSGAADSGILSVLRTRSTPEQIAAATNIDKQIIVDLCLALEAHGVVRQDGECYELTPDFALLESPNAAIPLSNLLHYAMVMMRTLQTIAPADSPYTTIAPEDILAMAKGSATSSLSSSPHVNATAAADMMPEVEERWLAGAHHLEVGCGVGNALLSTVTTYPKVTAVGIEIDESTATEAERRADLLGVADRVQVRKMDACELNDEAVFETIQWSQFFFPASTRPVVLQAMHRALKPGGYLFMPWLGSTSTYTSKRYGRILLMALRAMKSGVVSFLPSMYGLLGEILPGRREKERHYAAIQRLLYTQWSVPVRTESELVSEIRDNGFRVLRVIDIPASQLALTRGFLLAQRQPA